MWNVKEVVVAFTSGMNYFGNFCVNICNKVNKIHMQIPRKLCIVMGICIYTILKYPVLHTCIWVQKSFPKEGGDLWDKFVCYRWWRGFEAYFKSCKPTF